MRKEADMTKNDIRLTPEVVECINNLQTGGAKLWDTTIRKAIDCVIYNDSYGNAEERLKLVQELLYMQDMFSIFTQEGGAL